MIPHEALRRAICGEYVQLTDVSSCVISPFTMAGDGESLAAYIVDAGNGRLRITDDGDVLFNAATHGVELTPARRRHLRDIASECGIALSDDGELYVGCAPEEADAYVIKLLEAASRVSFATVAHRPRPLSQFERAVGHALRDAFGARIARRPEVVGDSGHQLTFSYGLDVGKASGALIQVIGAKRGKVDWDNVYKQAGKFDDLQHNDLVKVRCFAVLEPAEPESLQKAAVVLGRVARPVIYRQPSHLLEYLRAA